MHKITDFWPFATALYQDPATAQALMRLQDEANCDVLLILFALWKGQFHGQIPPPCWDAILASAQPWRRDVIEPLRAIRRRMKTQDYRLPSAPIREQVKQAELAAEQAQALALEALTLPCDGAGGFDAAERNLLSYIEAEARIIAPDPRLVDTVLHQLAVQYPRIDE
ncbi:MAG: TIGR02444 family protein [Neomegalonema sp.]|nr:TIGR02444 family protein [Neomegalonema sp.]